MNALEAKEILKKYFGYEAFRPMQAEIIERVCAGGDALVLMPTGGGKSLCYQIPALLMPGCCVVVSPLISLMKDQVEALLGNGVRAAYLNSSIDWREQQEVENKAFNGELDLLYVSPEKLLSQGFMPLLKRLKISLFAIDEAHCISQWGHDFRPEYTQMRMLREQFPQVPLIALTATADRHTREDILQQLGLTEAKVFIASFDRPNIRLEVRPARKRLEQIVDFIRARPDQPGIVYCLSRKSTENLAQSLLATGIKAGVYHAGLSDRERNEAQDDFINDRLLVVCATIAFGMGIDKSNVRWVIHYNMPKNIEHYYQEIGRSGRDGTSAHALLFYSYGDVMTYKDMLADSSPELLTLMHHKLDRMFQFATAVNCRRRMLLGYFGEHPKNDCGNCDVCLNPPLHIDGTELTQKALSAVARLKEGVSSNVLIDVLRGSKRQDLAYRGYDQIKTFGAGADVSAEHWRLYIDQLLSLGIIDIDVHDFYKVKLTPASWEILRGERQLTLAQAQSVEKKKVEREETRKRDRTRTAMNDELFEVLRKLRMDTARANGVPPYLVFSDATLYDMIEVKPSTPAEFLTVSGVGEKKMEQYGEVFMHAIQQFLLDKMNEGIRVVGATYLQTLELYKQGLSPESIAEKREVQVGTIYGHLTRLWEQGVPEVQIAQLITKEELEQVREAVDVLQHEGEEMKPVYEAMDGTMPYHKIRLAMALLRQHGK
jgi:ATP-dependent DNA helicase RecQ